MIILRFSYLSIDSLSMKVIQAIRTYTIITTMSTSNYFYRRTLLRVFGLLLVLVILVLPRRHHQQSGVVDGFANTMVSYSVVNKYPKYSPSSSSSTPPPPSSSSQISNLYDPPPSPRAKDDNDNNDDDDDESIIRAVGGPRAHVYGEMTANGFRTLASAFNIGGPSDDVFVDLGSGDGALVLQAAMEYNVKRSSGIELSKAHHEKAMDALNNIRSSSNGDAIAEAADRITLIHGDASSGDVVGQILESATVIWCSNLLFDDTLQRRIADTVSQYTTTTTNNSNNNEKKKKRVVVASLKPFPNDGIKGFDLLPQKLPLEMSWTAAGKERTGHPPLPGHMCSIYILRE